MGNEGALGVGNYLANHPAGLNATVTCGGSHNWDCTETNGVISMNGPNSSQFVKNYGFFVSLSAYDNTAVVTCTSCHNQHSMGIVSVTNGPNLRSAYRLLPDDVLRPRPLQRREQHQHRFKPGRPVLPPVPRR